MPGTCQWVLFAVKSFCTACSSTAVKVCVFEYTWYVWSGKISWNCIPGIMVRRMVWYEYLCIMYAWCTQCTLWWSHILAHLPAIYRRPWSHNRLRTKKGVLVEEYKRVQHDRTRTVVVPPASTQEKTTVLQCTGLRYIIPYHVQPNTMYQEHTTIHGTYIRTTWYTRKTKIRRRAKKKGK